MPANIIKLLHDLINGSRNALAKSITLVESNNAEHRKYSQFLLTECLKNLKTRPPLFLKSKRFALDVETYKQPKTLRIGLSGAPGVGKSTFIESFAMSLVNEGYKVAVLTRMYNLSRQDRAYVRPTPSRGTLGGVARNTHESIVMCEAAGYDIILVETVGVGQSETLVADMVDIFALLVPPAGGDELQKGIMELSDLVVVNKADGELINTARRAQIEYLSALKYMKRNSKVYMASSITGKGINEVWEGINEYYFLTVSEAKEKMDLLDGQESIDWDVNINSGFKRLQENSEVKSIKPILDKLLENDELTASQAADRIIEIFFNSINK
ncbi:ArgK protein domain-containing protein [Rozella allomycis CSF55]|uniref:ArgK protein domain-containing protein n=1 Tax=Rozella allomycis (strain CSF55) TaxID=988480 RepID=A0A075AZY0_ROZAC|nr:ArgK protein domain-containing protein [Rozella allomycis CSF55]|eukprot:EPZ35669.1 ArgK protein domain-containing protein [Rozella allomycis CSF55]